MRLNYLKSVFFFVGKVYFYECEFEWFILKMFYKNEVYEKCRVFVRIELIYVIKVFLENIFWF